MGYVSLKKLFLLPGNVKLSAATDRLNRQKTNTNVSTGFYNGLKAEKNSDDVPKKVNEHKESVKAESAQEIKPEAIKTGNKQPLKTLLNDNKNKAEKDLKSGSNKKVDVKKQCTRIEKSLNECFNIVQEIYDKYFANAKGLQSKESVLIGFNDYIISLLNHNLNFKSLSSEAKKEYVALFGNKINEGKKSDEYYGSKLQNEISVLPFALKMTIATDVHFKKEETQKILNEVYKIYSVTCGLCDYDRIKLKKELFETVINFANGQGLKIE